MFCTGRSEVAAINMVYGAVPLEPKVMTSSSSPHQPETGGHFPSPRAEPPCLIVNIVRGGPGLGGSSRPAVDYFQAVRAAGDYHLVVLAPSTIQETVDLVRKGLIWLISIHPVMILETVCWSDDEPVEFKEAKPRASSQSWATTG